MLTRGLAFALACALFLSPALAQEIRSTRPHNVILFVPDGLRGLKVTPETAPTMAMIRDKGVNFKNSHSLFPTFTTANASGMATGHYLGDTGDFSNTIYAGYPVHVPNAPSTVTPFLENDAVLGDVNSHFDGNYLDEDTILKIARTQGFSTASVGKVGPVLIFDSTERSGLHTVIVDDATGQNDKEGHPIGIPLSVEVKAALQKAALPLIAPTRGANGATGTFDKPGTKSANVEQQAYFAAVVAKVLLPIFKARNKPFIVVFWSRDPDGSQHNQGDSLNALTPGINGPTSLAGIKNADDNLREIVRAVNDLGLADTTDVMVSADHGFSTISKESKTSLAARTKYANVPEGFLPPGFLAVDLAKSLALPLFDPNTAGNAAVAADAYPKAGNALIGNDPSKPDIAIASNGGSDLIYLPNNDRTLAARVVDVLLEQDYVSGLFVDDRLGPIAGTLPLGAINLAGNAVTPTPSIAVNFRSFATGCEMPVLCSAEVADTNLQQGQGMHGSFSRADTMNFMAAMGPDFKAGFVDEAPVSNADIGQTIAKILKLNLPARGHLIGRPIDEALPGGTMPHVTTGAERSEPAANGLLTILTWQQVGWTRYFDAAGFPDRTVGLDAAAPSR
ncbi:MAG TPA: alkaline phosphatase family protein [Xanthobacteraceae bacterium]|jgi:hypothetical protein